MKKNSDDEASGKPLNAGQKKKATKQAEKIDILIGSLSSSIQEISKDIYREAVPPSLIPKSQQGLALLKARKTSMELVLTEGWRGEAESLLSEAAAAAPRAMASSASIQEIIKSLVEDREAPAD